MKIFHGPAWNFWHTGSGSRTGSWKPHIYTFWSCLGGIWTEAWGFMKWSLKKFLLSCELENRSYVFQSIPVYYITKHTLCFYPVSPLRPGCLILSARAVSTLRSVRIFTGLTALNLKVWLDWVNSTEKQAPCNLCLEMSSLNRTSDTCKWCQI